MAQTSGTSGLSALPKRGGGLHRGTGEKPKQAKSTLRRLLSLMGRDKLLLVLVGLSVVICTLCGLWGAALLGQAVDALTQPDILGAMWPVLIRGAIAYTLCALTTWSESYLVLRIGQHMVYTLRRLLLDKYHALSLQYLDKQTLGDLMSRMSNDVGNVADGLVQAVSTCFSSALYVVGSMAMMLLINPILAAVAVVTVPLAALLTAQVSRRTHKHYEANQRALGAMSGMVEETVSGQRVVKVFCREPQMRAEFDRHNAALRQAGQKAALYSGMIHPLMNALNNFGYALVAATGGLLALTGSIQVGSIATVLNLSRSFSRPILSIANQFNQIQSAIAGAERVFDILDNEQLDDDLPGARSAHIGGDVEFSHVTFGYDPDHPVLEDVNFHAERGSTIALVGHTGAGKTTIVNLLTCFYETDAGCIRIDGRDIRSITKSSLRAQVGMVLQDTYLFTGSVRDNIRYGDLAASDEALYRAARMSGAEAFIRRLTDGYDTLLTDGGGNLSQGQRQLLAIARALLKDPAILILDEATSSVDTRTEVHIQKAMLTLLRGRTAFVIAHRLSTIREADCILVMRAGRIVQRGSHEQLMRQGGEYAQLYRTQLATE